MIILKCDFCGFEQLFKKKMSKDFEYKVEHCEQMWCDCKACKAEHPRPNKPIPGHVIHWDIEHGWTFLLTREDAAYVESLNPDGSWWPAPNPTPEYLASVLRAKTILNLGLQKLKEEGKI